MYSNWNKKNSAGFTLVELVVAITLLSIVIIVLLPMFPHLLNWSKKTDETLVSGNLLDHYVVQLKNDEQLITYIDSASTVENCSIGGTPYALEGDYSTNINNQVFSPKLTLCQTEKENELNLYRGHISVMADGSEVSDTYFYITAAGDEDE
ncbi:type II secretion system protein [Virgibacillus sp. W0181]|uniref:type II secretion system protein n=1 Tax=Virgibacillus sp. W0181 TaxID=3391581 RepID=UPI003F456726